MDETNPLETTLAKEASSQELQEAINELLTFQFEQLELEEETDLEEGCLSCS